MARDDIKRLHSELEDVFNELWHGPRFGVPRRGFRPHIDVMRTEEPDELRVVSTSQESTPPTCRSSSTSGRS